MMSSKDIFVKFCTDIIYGNISVTILVLLFKFKNIIPFHVNKHVKIYISRIKLKYARCTVSG